MRIIITLFLMSLPAMGLAFEYSQLQTHVTGVGYNAMGYPTVMFADSLTEGNSMICKAGTHYQLSPEGGPNALNRLLAVALTAYSTKAPYVLAQIDAADNCRVKGMWISK